MSEHPTPKISATVITLNEEENIAACLESLSWVDEIVVLDSQSTDRTVEIAKKHTDKVFVEEWKGQGSHKNRAAELASGPWIFSIDADERVTPELAAEIREIVKNPQTDVYAVRRKNIYRGQWIKHGGWWPDWVNRLFKKGRSHFNDAVIHDSLQADGRVGRLNESLIHESFHSAGDFLERAYRYAVHQAPDMFWRGKRATTFTALSHGLFAFPRNYLLRAGFLDGSAGLLIAVYHSVGTFYQYMLLRELCIKKDNTSMSGGES